MKSNIGISKNNIPFLKGYIIGIIICCLVISLLMIAAALAITSIGSVPVDYLGIIIGIIDGAGVFAGAFVCSKIIKSRGILNGLALGIIAFVIMMIAGFASSAGSLGENTLIKLAFSLIAGVLGGFAGVAKSHKIKY